MLPALPALFFVNVAIACWLCATFGKVGLLLTCLGVPWAPITLVYWFGARAIVRRFPRFFKDSDYENL